MAVSNIFNICNFCEEGAGACEVVDHWCATLLLTSMLVSFFWAALVCVLVRTRSGRMQVRAWSELMRAPTAGGEDWTPPERPRGAPIAPAAHAPVALEDAPAAAGQPPATEVDMGSGTPVDVVGEVVRDAAELADAGRA